MKLALFDDYRLGVVSADGRQIADVTAALPELHDPEPLGAGWWLRLCRDFAALRPRLEQAARMVAARPLDAVQLRAPVLNPSKIVACASNYGAHVAEMRESAQANAWLLEFDVFLKAPSAISGPRDPVVLPSEPVAQGGEIHYECELALVIGPGGKDIAEADALAHVLGYLIGIDVTLRGQGDRSRRKSYDTFCPLGPWLTTADEITDPHALDIALKLNGTPRQQVNTRDLLVEVPGIIAYASRVMRLEPGDVILTGAPPGVGAIQAGDEMEAAISGLGQMTIPVVMNSL